MYMVPFNVERRRLLEDTVGLEFGVRTLRLRSMSEYDAEGAFAFPVITSMHIANRIYVIVIQSRD